MINSGILAIIWLHEPLSVTRQEHSPRWTQARSLA